MAKIETSLTAEQVKIAEALFGATYAVSIGKRSGESVHIPLPLADMPAAAWLKIMSYGAQRTFNDAVGGSDKTAEDKVAKIKEMIDAYLAGDIGRRASASVDPVTAAIRSIIRQLWKAQDADGYKAAKDEDDIDDRLDAIFAGQPEDAQAAIRKRAEADVAARAERAKGISSLTIAVAK